MKAFKATVKAMDQGENDEKPIAVPTIKKPAKRSVKNILEKLKDDNNEKLLTPTQAKKLASLKFKSGETILTLKHAYFLYEMISIIKYNGYESVYNFLTTDWEKVFGEHNTRNKMIFENPLLSKSKEKLYHDMDIFRNTVDVVTGAVDCPKCRSSETISIDKQNRSADEATTIRVVCLACNYKWTA